MFAMYAMYAMYVQLYNYSKEKMIKVTHLVKKQASPLDNDMSQFEISLLLTNMQHLNPFYSISIYIGISNKLTLRSDIT